MSDVDVAFSRWLRLTDIYARLCERGLDYSPCTAARLLRAAQALARSEAELARCCGLSALDPEPEPAPDHSIPSWLNALGKML